MTVGGLTFLDEFNEKPVGERRERKQSQEESTWRGVSQLPVYDVKHYEDRTVSHRFIELGRVAREEVHPCKYEGPGNIGRNPHDFRIEQVADTDEQSSERNWNYNSIQYPEVGDICSPPAVEVKCGKYPDGTPVAGKPADPKARTVPELYDFEWIAEVENRIIEQAMAQSCTNKRSKYHIIDQAVEVFLRLAFRSEDFPHDVKPDNESRKKTETVPSDGDGPQGQQYRADIPGDVCEDFHRYRFRGKFVIVSRKY